MEALSGNPGDSLAAKRGVAGPTSAAPTLHIDDGVCLVLLAYDVGRAINLDEAEQRITASRQREAIRHKRRAPHYFRFKPAPLRVTQTLPGIAVGQHTTAPTVDAVIYDFGAVSVTYIVPLRGPLTELRVLGDELWDHRGLREASRAVVETVLQTIRPAVTKPEISDLVEDYSIYQIKAFSPRNDLPDALAEHAPLLAQILRAEGTTLSRQEIQDALSCEMSFGPDDRAIIDWNAALVFDADADDVLAVLEFANVELLELRYLDDELDAALDRAYEAWGRRTGWRYVLSGAKAEDLWRIAQLQMDSAVLFEGVNNALKLLGDQYLARVYRLASQRFHFNDWDASILRKLQTLESIYSKISDRQANRRLELLEWIIIVLIAISIATSLLPGAVGK